MNEAILNVLIIIACLIISIVNVYSYFFTNVTVPFQFLSSVVFIVLILLFTIKNWRNKYRYVFMLCIVILVLALIANARL